MKNLEPIIYDLEEDRDGSFWIGTYSAGILHWTPEDGILCRYFYEEENPTLSNNLVNAVLLDHEGTLWVGTNRGLNRYGPSERPVFKPTIMILRTRKA